MPGFPEALRPALLASRGRSRDVSRRWAAGAEVRALRTAFADCPLDGPGPAADRAEQLLANGDWAAALLDPLLAALDKDPLFEPPLRARRDGLRTGLVLHDCAAVSLVASVSHAAALARAPEPRTIALPGRMTVTRVLRSGGAHWRRWHVEEEDRCIALPPLPLAEGAVYRSDGRNEARLLSGARSDVAVLTATIRAGAAPLLREFDLATRRLCRIADGDDRSSRAGMLLALLRASGRTDAGPCFEAATCDAAHQLRWAAMREWLMLDAGAALPRLAQMAEQDPHAQVRAAARRTLETLAARQEPEPCPA
ncbi:MAG: hypothetical protein J7500_05100 [Sphingomonas sp.]|uniref:hypothetical protein n=1 Tax=Sphingomonas sp. TaxID=28214 RepID=UPI001B097FE6|nr:hypothetical protein [Sphingomonas sp.]MBO9622071.1 hypothetical protein [Sphingomonas sp.]